jgi:hypothetical protein
MDRLRSTSLIGRSLPHISCPCGLFSVGAPALPSLSKEKIMQQNFPFESEPKETEKSSSHWSSVAEKLERYGSHALN